MSRRGGVGRVTGLLVLWYLWASPSLLLAQACDGGGNYRLRVTPGAVSITTPEIQDLDAGQTVTRAVRIRVQPRGRANRDWEVCIRSRDATLGGQAKPISDVEWQVPGSGSWQPLSTFDRLVQAGRGNARIDLLLRVRVDWADDPADYGTLLTFSAARTGGVR